MLQLQFPQRKNILANKNIKINLTISWKNPGSLGRVACEIYHRLYG